MFCRKILPEPIWAFVFRHIAYPHTIVELQSLEDDVSIAYYLTTN